MLIGEKVILEKISEYKKCKDINKYISGEKMLPKHYCCDDKDNVKAIILGCDPTNTKKEYEFETVFGLRNTDEDEYGNLFFRDIYENLKSIGLNKSNIYVQNLCRNYFVKETSAIFKEGQLFFNERAISKNLDKNSLEWKAIIDNEYEKNEWIRVAIEWITQLKQELDELDSERKLPILITSEYLIPPLVYDKYDLYSASYYYKRCKFITKDQNKLQRTIIPLFRHCTYILDEKYLEKRIKSDKYCKNYVKALGSLKHRNTKYKQEVIKVINSCWGK